MRSSPIISRLVFVDLALKGFIYIAIATGFSGFGNLLAVVMLNIWPTSI